jgi:hypothetical protein
VKPDRRYCGSLRRILYSWLAILVGAALLVTTVAAGPGDASPAIDSFGALGEAIMACWKPPAGADGAELTLRFGLTGQGVLRGPPMVTYSKLIGSKELQKSFVLSALRAVADCTPVKLTDGFGRVVAQRVLTLRFVEPVKGRVAI